MDLPWGDKRSRQFVTGIGLITSDGPYGPNIMAAEWTHHISYSPGLIVISIHAGDATAMNIRKTKVFGVNLCATDQNVLSSVAGGSTGKDVNKISALRELGFRFSKAKRINVLMVDGAALNIECRLVKRIRLGDHVMLAGEVLEATMGSGKEPLAYHGGKYWRLGEQIMKPPAEEIERIRTIVGKHRRKGNVARKK